MTRYGFFNKHDFTTMAANGRWRLWSSIEFSLKGVQFYLRSLVPVTDRQTRQTDRQTDRYVAIQTITVCVFATVIWPASKRSGLLGQQEKLP